VTVSVPSPLSNAQRLRFSATFYGLVITKSLSFPTKMIRIYADFNERDEFRSCGFFPFRIASGYKAE